MNKILLFSCLLAFSTVFASGGETDSLLRALERHMVLRPIYDQIRMKRIITLKRAKGHTVEAAKLYGLNNKLIAEYIPYQFDQAVSLIEENIEVAKRSGNAQWLNDTNVKLAGVLSASGNYKEAVDLLDHIQTKKLSPEMRILYLRYNMEVNANLSYYTPIRSSKQRFVDLCLAYSDSLYRRLPNNADESLFIAERNLRDHDSLEESLEFNSKRLSMVQIGTRDFSRITFSRSQTYQKLGNEALRKKYLILSAISDIMGSVKDNASLTELAIILFKQNDIERAHKYINFSFEDAVFYNSRLRYIAISNTFPIINKAYETQNERQQSRLRTSLLAISVLSVILLLAVIFVYRQVKAVSRGKKALEEANRRLKTLNDDLLRANLELDAVSGELRESNKIKELYIGNFLNNCSGYIDQLDAYRKTIKKMLLAKKFNELYEKTDSSDVIDIELKHFYKNFDTAFLHIYPDFVGQVNALLLADEQLSLKKGELLSTEMRIFALIRLGISDSATIAKFLRYSVNTIYNYRVKIRNKAISRDDFEEQIEKIGAFATA